ncbi:MAG: TrmH family RNA methyltransferase [Candidatus Eisenbacteria bacterium]
MVRFNAAEIERYWRDQNPRRRALRAWLDARRLPYGVAVENLTKDANLGNLIRTANAFLCGEILLVGSPVFDSAGAADVHRFERMRHFADPEAFLDHVKTSGYRLIAVEIDAGAQWLHRFEFPERPLFLFGSELRGLSPGLAAHAQQRLMIPQYGLMPCLNVNVSCSIVLYHYVTHAFPDLLPAPIAGAKFQLDPGSGQKGS